MGDYTQVSHLVIRVARAHWLVASSLLQRLGLYPGQELLLMRLWENDHQLQVELAKTLRVDPSTVTRTLQTLERQGLLTRRPSEHDGRAMVVSLTEAGRDLREQVEQLWAELDSITTKGMTERNIGDAIRLMRRMEANLSEHC